MERDEKRLEELGQEELLEELRQYFQQRREIAVDV